MQLVTTILLRRNVVLELVHVVVLRILVQMHLIHRWRLEQRGRRRYLLLLRRHAKVYLWSELGECQVRIHGFTVGLWNMF